MNVELDQDMLHKLYEHLSDEIRELENKKEQVISLGPVGYQLAKMIDIQITKRQEELDGVKYYLT